MIWGPIVASLASGFLSGAMKGKGGGSVGYDMPTMNPSPYDADNQRLSATYAQNALLNAQAGRLSPGLEILLDNIRKRQLMQEKVNTFGREGDRGGSAIDIAQSLGAMGGVGPRNLQAQGRKVSNDYADRVSKIQNYIDSLKFSQLQNQGNQAFTQIQAMPRSMEIPWTGQTPSVNIPNAPGVDLSGLTSVDWGPMMDKIFTKQTPVVQQVAAQYNPVAGVDYVKTQPYQI